MNVKNIVYGRQDGEAGPGIAYSTLPKRLGGSYVFVFQCNAFCEVNISNLKKILRVIDKNLRVRDE